MPSDLLKELKEHLISSLHAQKIEQYKTIYRNKNSGRNPSKKDIDNFVAMMIASKSNDKEAQDIVDTVVKKITDKSKIKGIFFNTSFTLPLCGVLFTFLMVLVFGFPDFLKTNSVRYTLIGTTLTLLLITIIGTVIHFFKKEK